MVKLTDLILKTKNGFIRSNIFSNRSDFNCDCKIYFLNKSRLWGILNYFIRRFKICLDVSGPFNRITTNLKFLNV